MCTLQSASDPTWGGAYNAAPGLTASYGTSRLISLLPRHIEVSAFVTLNTQRLTLIPLSHFDKSAYL